MICLNCSAYYRANCWNNSRFCNNCFQFEEECSEVKNNSDESLMEEINRLQEDHGTSRTKPVFYD